MLIRWAGYGNIMVFQFRPLNHMALSREGVPTSRSIFLVCLLEYHWILRCLILRP
jgi:hypothetical protein